MNDPKHTTWTSGANVLHVYTYRETGESEPDWDARHRGVVAFWQSAYPPD